MKLNTKRLVTYYECICTGSMSSLEEDKPLAKLLEKIDNGDFQGGALSRFYDGLISNFESEGLINSGALTPKAREIITTQKSWKMLRGQFKMSFVQSGDLCYIVSCEPYYSDNTRDFKLCKGKSFNIVGEYKNDREMHIKDVKLDSNCYLSLEKNVDLNCIYDYEDKKCSYSVEANSGIIEFEENIYTFKLIDETKAWESLNNAISNYGCFSISGTSVILDKYDTNNPLIESVISQVFGRGSFFVRVNEAEVIEDIKLSITVNSVAKELLLEFLSRKAQEKYCGISEIQAATRDFYSLFDKCSTIRQKSQGLFESLMEYTSNKKPTAHLRLQAYRDLAPLDKDNSYIAQVKDYSGDEMSMTDLVNDLIGRNDVISVTTITKYAYNNAGISVGLSLFANALNNRHIDFKVITSEGDKQKSYAKKYYNELLNNENLKVNIKKADDIKDIHDRYFLLEKSNGRIWYKMSGEIDALQFKNVDFADVDENTQGEIKEMTVYTVEENGIQNKVKTIMGV